MTSPINLHALVPGEDEHVDPHAHLWPDVRRPDSEWMDRSKCATMRVSRDHDPFDPTSPQNKGRPNKDRLAVQVCAGCPVVRQCAQAALHYQSRGIFRAATYIPSHGDDLAKFPGAIARLERIAGIAQTQEVAA